MTDADMTAEEYRQQHAGAANKTPAQKQWATINQGMAAEELRRWRAMTGAQRQAHSLRTSLAHVTRSYFDEHNAMLVERLLGEPWAHVLRSARAAIEALCDELEETAK